MYYDFQDQVDEYQVKVFQSRRYWFSILHVQGVAIHSLLHTGLASEGDSSCRLLLLFALCLVDSQGKGE